MCKYCDFDEHCGKQVGEHFPEGFGVTAAIQQDRTFYSIVNTDGLDGIIYGINYCPMCGRKLENEEVEQKIKEFINEKV